MVIWVSKEKTGRPNDQRAKVLKVKAKKNEIDVEMCGDGKKLTIEPTDVCGIELGTAINDIDIMFKVTSTGRSYREV